MDYKFKVGVGGTVVAHLCESVKEGTYVFCDRYFTSIGLINYMVCKKIHVTGTIMNNRIPRDAKKYSSEKKLAKSGRGSCDVIVRQCQTTAVVKWFDNKAVTMASSVLARQPEDICRRYSKKEKKYINVPHPAIVWEYYINMGGVDLCDRMISFYRMKVRTKKWTVRSMFHFVDLALINAWLKYHKDAQELRIIPRREILSFLDFRLNVAEYMTTYREDPDINYNEQETGATGNPPERHCKTAVSSKRRHVSGVLHLPEMSSLKNSMRCRNTGCPGKTKMKCLTCEVYLCVRPERSCFAEFHQ